MKINYTRPNTYSVDGVTLYPGINIVPNDVAAKFLEHPSVKKRIRDGLIEVMSESEAPEPDDVSGMADIAALRDLAKGNARNPAVKAARERLAEIDAAATADE